MPRRRKQPVYLVNLWALIGDQVEAWIDKHPPIRSVTAAQVERLLQFVLFPDLLKYDSPRNRKTVGKPEGRGENGVMQYDWRRLPKTKEDRAKDYERLGKSFKRLHAMDADFAFGLAAHIRKVWSREDQVWIAEKFLRLTGHVSSLSGRQRRFIADDHCHDKDVLQAIENLTGKRLPVQAVKDARQKMVAKDEAFARRLRGEGGDSEPRPGPSQSSYP